MSQHPDPGRRAGPQHQLAQEAVSIAPRQPTTVTTVVPSAFSNMSVTVSAIIAPDGGITARATITAVPRDDGQDVQHRTGTSYATSGLSPSGIAPSTLPVDTVESITNNLQSLSLQSPRSTSITGANSFNLPCPPSSRSGRTMAFANEFDSPNSSSYVCHRRPHIQLPHPVRHHPRDPQPSSNPIVPTLHTRSTTPAVVSLPTSPHPSRPSLSSECDEEGKWYVVTVGRCTGVFRNWSQAQELTTGISGNCHKSFKSKSTAYNYYNKMKTAGLVKVRRNADDDVGKFGPIEEAIA